MKNLHQIIILILLNLLIFLSCKENDTSLIIIDIKNTLNRNVTESFKLNDISNNIRLIPVETNDSTLLGDFIIVGTNEEDIVIRDDNLTSYKKAVYFINKNTGTVSSIIDNWGQGPHDYTRLGDVHLNNLSNTIYISDYSKTNEYTHEGNFIKSFKNDSIAFFRIFPNGDFAVSYSPLVNNEFALGVYDSLWTQKRKGMPKVKGEFDMVYFDGIFEFNRDLFYKLAHSDTLYRITIGFDEPYLVHSKGQYRLPDEIKANREQRDKYGYRYIQQDFGRLISKYYFLTYYYNEKFHYEIWNIENSSLVYKSIFSRDGGMSGVPIVIRGLIIYVWPAYVSNDSIYCIITAEDAITLLPELPKDTNQIILELKVY